MSFQEKFVGQANKHHQTIKFAACKDAIFLETTIYKGQRFNKESVLAMRTPFNPTETLQYTFFAMCHPPGAEKGFVKGEPPLRLLLTSSSNKTFELTLSHLKKTSYGERLSAKLY